MGLTFDVKGAGSKNNPKCGENYSPRFCWSKKHQEKSHQSHGALWAIFCIKTDEISRLDDGGGRQRGGKENG